MFPRSPDLCFGKYGPSWVQLSKNRYEHIHVRFSQAIPGLRNFWKAVPTKSLYQAFGEWGGFYKDSKRNFQASGRLLRGSIAQTGEAFPKICGAMDGGAEASAECGVRLGKLVMAGVRPLYASKLCIGPSWGCLSKNFEGHGWPEISAQGCACSGFWKGILKEGRTPEQEAPAGYSQN